MFGTLTLCDSVKKTPRIGPYVVNQRFTYVGRDKDCDIRFENPKCDRKQFLLTACGNGVVKIQNLSKKHDTIVNGESIGFQVDHDLHEQDSIHAAGKTMMWSYETSDAVSNPTSTSLKRTRQSEPVRKVAVVTPNRRELMVDYESLHPEKRRKTLYGSSAGGSSYDSPQIPLHDHEPLYTRRTSHDATSRMEPKSSKSRFSSGATPGRLSSRLSTPASTRKNEKTSFVNSSDSQSIYFPTIQEGMEPIERLNSQQSEQSYHFSYSESFLNQSYGVNSTPASYFSTKSRSTPRMITESPNTQLRGQRDEKDDSLFVNTSGSSRIRQRHSQRSFHSNKDHYSPRDSVPRTPQPLDDTPSHSETRRRNSALIGTPGSSSFSPLSYYDTDYVLLSPRGKAILNKNYGRDSHSSQSPHSPAQKTLDFSTLPQQSPHFRRTPRRSLSVQVLTKSLKKKIDRGSQSNRARKSQSESRTDELLARNSRISESKLRKFSQNMRKESFRFGSPSTPSKQVHNEEHSYVAAIQSPSADSLSSHKKTKRKSRNNKNKVHKEISIRSDVPCNKITSTPDMQLKSSRLSRDDENTNRASQIESTANKSRRSVNPGPQESPSSSVLETSKSYGTLDADLTGKLSRSSRDLRRSKRDTSCSPAQTQSKLNNSGNPSLERICGDFGAIDPQVHSKLSRRKSSRSTSEVISNLESRRSLSAPSRTPTQSSSSRKSRKDDMDDSLDVAVGTPKSLRSSQLESPSRSQSQSRTLRRSRKSDNVASQEFSPLGVYQSAKQCVTSDESIITKTRKSSFKEKAPSRTPTQSGSSRKSRSDHIDDSLDVAYRTPKTLRSSQVESPIRTQSQSRTSRRSRKSENQESSPVGVHQSKKHSVKSDEPLMKETRKSSLKEKAPPRTLTQSSSSRRSRSDNIDDSVDVASETTKSLRSSQVESPSLTQSLSNTSRRSRKSVNQGFSPASVRQSAKQSITTDESIITKTRKSSLKEKAPERTPSQSSSSRNLRRDDIGGSLDVAAGTPKNLRSGQVDSPIRTQSQSHTSRRSRKSENQELTPVGVRQSAKQSVISDESIITKTRKSSLKENAPERTPSQSSSSRKSRRDNIDDSMDVASETPKSLRSSQLESPIRTQSQSHTSRRSRKSENQELTPVGVGQSARQSVTSDESKVTKTRKSSLKEKAPSRTPSRSSSSRKSRSDDIDDFLDAASRKPRTLRSSQVEPPSPTQSRTSRRSRKSENQEFSPVGVRQSAKQSVTSDESIVTKTRKSSLKEKAPSRTPSRSSSPRKSRSDDIDDSVDVASRTPRTLRSSQVEPPSPTQSRTSRRSRKSENQEFSPAGVRQSVTSDESIITKTRKSSLKEKAHSRTPTQSSSFRKSRSDDIDDSVDVASRTPKTLRSSQVESPSPTQSQSRRSRKSDNVASQKFSPAGVHQSPKQPVTSDEPITTINKESSMMEKSSSRTPTQSSFSRKPTSDIIDDSLQHVASGTPSSLRSSQFEPSSPTQSRTSRRSRKSETLASQELSVAGQSISIISNQSPKRSITSDKVIPTVTKSFSVDGITNQSSRSFQNVDSSALLQLSQDIDAEHELIGLPAIPRFSRKSKTSVDNISQPIVSTILVKSEPNFSLYEDISSSFSLQSAISPFSKLDQSTSEDIKPLYRVFIPRPEESLESSSTRNSRALDDSTSLVANVSSIPTSQVMFSTPSSSKKKSFRITSTPFPKGLDNVRSVSSESDLPIAIDTNIQVSYVSPDSDSSSEDDTSDETDTPSFQANSGSSARTCPIERTPKSKGSISFVVKSIAKKEISKNRSFSIVSIKNEEVTPPTTPLEVNRRSSRKSGTVVEKLSLDTRSASVETGKPAARLNDSSPHSVQMTTAEKSQPTSSLASPSNNSTPTRVWRSQSNLENSIETNSQIPVVNVPNSPTKSHVRSGSLRTSRKSESPEKRTPPRTVSPKVVLRSSKKSASKSKQDDIGTPTSAFKTNPRRNVMSSSRKSNPAVKKLKLDPNEPDKNKTAALRACHKKKSPVKTSDMPGGSSRRSFDTTSSSPVKLNKTLPRGFKYHRCSSVPSTAKNSLIDTSNQQPTPLNDLNSQPKQPSPEDDLLNALDLSRKNSIEVQSKKPTRRLRSSSHRSTPAGSSTHQSTHEENMIPNSSKKLLFRPPLVDYEGSLSGEESRLNSSNLKTILIPSPTTSSNEPMSRVLTTSPVVDYTDTNGKKQTFLASPNSKTGGIKELIPSDEIDLSGVRDLFEHSSLVLNAAPTTPDKPRTQRGRKRAIIEVASSPKMAESPPARRNLRRKRDESTQSISSGCRGSKPPTKSQTSQQRLRSRKSVKDNEASTSKKTKEKVPPVEDLSPKKQTPLKSASKSKKNSKTEEVQNDSKPKTVSLKSKKADTKKNKNSSLKTPVVSPRKLRNAAKPKKPSPKQVASKKDAKTENQGGAKLSTKKIEKSSSKRAKTSCEVQSDAEPESISTKVKKLQVSPPKKQGKSQKADNKKNKISSSKLATPVVSPRKLRNAAKPKKVSPKQVTRRNR